MKHRSRSIPWCVVLLMLPAGCAADPPGTGYPVHRDIVATTFWVGEVFDPHTEDGSQVLSAYDDDWLAHYGGCDGVTRDGRCETERRTAANGFFPTAMTPKENPFYLDLPFDDVGDPVAFAQRATVVPWAKGTPRDRSVSVMKNRWVKLSKGGATCYGQIEDAGPALYHDSAYVFGTARPANTQYNGAGLDVSPALNGCLGFADRNGENDRVDWQFVAAGQVPSGPWRRIVTSSQVDHRS